MVTGGNSPPPGLGGTGGPPAGGGGAAGGNALAMTAPLGQNVVQQRNRKKQVCGWVSTYIVRFPSEYHHHRMPKRQRLSLSRQCRQVFNSVLHALALNDLELRLVKGAMSSRS